MAIVDRNTRYVKAKSDHELLFGDLLKERRKKANLSQQEFADMLKVSRNTIINWEADKSKPDYSLIPELCSLLHMKLHELFHMDAETNSISLNGIEERVSKQLRQLDYPNQRVVEKMIATMVDEVCLAKDQKLKETFKLFTVMPGTKAAGLGNYVPEETPEYVFLQKNNINIKADGIALVKGDSMEPVYHSGDYVYYKATDSASPGDDVIVDTDEGAVIKRLAEDRTLRSLNSAYPYPLKSEDNSFAIRGIVLGTVFSTDKPDKEVESVLPDLFAEEIHEFCNRNGANDWD